MWITDSWKAWHERGIFSPSKRLDGPSCHSKSQTDNGFWEWTSDCHKPTSQGHDEKDTEDLLKSIVNKAAENPLEVRIKYEHGNW